MVPAIESPRGLLGKSGLAWALSLTQLRPFALAITPSQDYRPDVKILIEMVPEHYDGFLSKCVDLWQPEFALLKSGVVLRRQIAGREQRIIAILCEEFQAHKLLAAANALFPPAVDDIKRALDPLRDL